MKQFLATICCFFCILLSCEKPSQGIIINPPDTHPTLTPNNNDNQNPGNGNTDNPGNNDNPPAVSPSGYIIVGYATYWDKTMPDPALLTHINYSFAHIKSDFESLDIKTPSRLQQIAALKKSNADLKVVLSVGGWGAGNFSEMAASETHRKNFCKNCLNAVKSYNLDGIDLDWEYPTSNSAGISSSPNDTENFTLLLKDLRATLGNDYLLTMASSASAKYVDLRFCVVSRPVVCSWNTTCFCPKWMVGCSRSPNVWLSRNSPRTPTVKPGW